MSSLGMIEAKLPPGFRFHPRDDELVCDYLLRKVNDPRGSSLLIDVDLNKCEPWDIPGISCIGGNEWYFYSKRDRKYATGLRTNRATVSGYWKATGKDRLIFRKCSLIGMRKTLVFYQGRAPKGKKTEWVMHEFGLEGPHAPPKNSSSKEDWVLCRVFYKDREVDVKPISNSMDSTPTNTTTTNSNSAAATPNCYDETGSSPLPSLMDSYITFDQTTPNQNMDINTFHHQQQQHHNVHHEQVPCFSILSPASTQPNVSQIFQHMDFLQPSKNNSIVIPSPNFACGNNRVHEIDRAAVSIGDLSPLLPCDAHVIKALLCHLSKAVESSHSPPNNGTGGGGGVDGSASLGEGGGGGEEGSSDSYSSDVGLPTHTMWSHYS